MRESVSIPAQALRAQPAPRRMSSPRRTRADGSIPIPYALELLAPISRSRELGLAGGSLIAARAYRPSAFHFGDFKFFFGPRGTSTVTTSFACGDRALPIGARWKFVLDRVARSADDLEFLRIAGFWSLT